MADERILVEMIAAWNAHDLDRILALYTDDPVYEEVTLGEIHQGRAAVREFFGGGFTAFPDLRFERTWALVAGERAASEWAMIGTHDGDFTGLPATHKPFRVRGASVFELVGDKLHRQRDYCDLATLLTQLGVMPQPATP